MPRDLLLELGTEELPASFIGPALEELRRLLIDGMAQSRLKHGEISLYGTPRRLAARVADVSERAQDIEREVLGPSAKVAFDRDGRPTKAAEKFAQSAGIAVEQLKRVSTPKGEYVGARVEERGKDANQIVPDVISAAIHGIRFKKSMRWGDVEQSFARPVHWIVALLGKEVVPVVFADVRSGRTTYGHRFLAPGPIELRSPAEYADRLRDANVIAEINERRQLLLERVRVAASATKGQLLEDLDLADQVVNLVELPNPVVGSFDPSFLDLPAEVLVQEMKSHQRYFSIVDSDGRLLPKFIAVSNTPVKNETLSLRGYERVLRARLSDARFFFDQDRKVRLIDRVPKLARVVFQQNLGSYFDKVERIKQLVQFIAKQTDLGEHSRTLERAATLAKADLVTGMVQEFPELQGVMGREYAIADGEPKAVALAIFEHYLPRSAKDSLPTEDPGAILGIADRADTLCAIFAVGKPPTGAADPFGLRRSCLAIISIVLARAYRLSLSHLVAEALRLLQPRIDGLKKKPAEGSGQAQILDFFRARLKVLWTENHRPDLVEAVLSAGFDDIVAARLRLEALSARLGTTDFTPLALAFKRVVNIVEKQGTDIPPGPLRPEKLVEEAERRLYGEAESIRKRVQQMAQTDQYSQALGAIAELKPAVDDFFNRVMVMTEDRSIRENRVRLLKDVGSLFNYVADFSKIQADFANPQS